MFKFPGGEVHISDSSESNHTWYYHHSDGATIVAHIRSSDDLIELFLLTDRIRRKYSWNVKINVYVPYFPYARQDKIHVDGDPLSLKVIADLFNLQNYSKVMVLDPHSDVLPALLNNCVVLPRSWIGNINKDDYDCIVCPDAGARKKIVKDQQILNLPIVYADKIRDPATGKLSGFEVHADSVPKRCLIIDDICDGGGTFSGIAKALKELGAEVVDLAVTHGIFSKGVCIPEINTIYTTDSFYSGENLQVIRFNA